MLAPFAVRPEQSRGRRYPEPPHAYRSDFQRDRDRIIHARAFRRLENKTQVFASRYSDHFRNRLTHTIEVAQISRTVAAQLGLNAELTEALALAHDIGHPPFGHAGEKTLDAVMRAHGSFFDHNLHALRIVEDFERRYIGFPGLNLTFEVREGIIKHSRDYNIAEFPGLAEYALELLPPLEAQLIDLTDEIAYNTADLDDGFEARILSVEQIRAGVPAFDRFYRKVEQKSARAPEQLKFNEALRAMFNHMAGDLIATTAARLRSAGVTTLDDVRRFGQRLAAFSEEMDAERRHIKSFLYENLYYSKPLLPEKRRAEHVISTLFEYWMAHPDTLPASYREKHEQESLPRLVCDYIAGMTDNFILEQHKRICGRDSRVVEKRNLGD